MNTEMPSGRKTSILIADDDANLRKLILTTLDFGIYDIRTANTGLNALEIAREFRPEIVLLDLIMPGMGGLEVCKHLRADANQMHTYILLITGHDPTQLHLNVSESGANGLILKPFSPLELIKHIEDRPQQSSPEVT